MSSNNIKALAKPDKVYSRRSAHDWLNTCCFFKGKFDKKNVNEKHPMDFFYDLRTVGAFKEMDDPTGSLELLKSHEDFDIARLLYTQEGGGGTKTR